MSTGRSFLETIAATISATLLHLLENLLGAAVSRPVLGPVTLAELLVLALFFSLALLVHGLAAAWLRRRAKPGLPEVESGWRPVLLRAVSRPFYTLIWIYGAYFACLPLLLKFQGDQEEPAALRLLADRLFDLSVFLTLVWMAFRVTRAVEARLASLTAGTAGKMDDLIVALLGRSLRIIIPVVGIIFALPAIGLSYGENELLSRAGGILLIVAVAWVLFQFVHLGEQAVLAKYDIKATDNLQARKVYTQVHVLSKTAYVLITIFAAASILMLFEEVRRFGTSLLASAGVVGIIVGVAAQRTIANLFAGFQIALTQPIRLDDVVIVEGEWGRIEEITLTYVIVRIWDERRLVVPISHFIEKPFQNWTRVSADLLGSVFLYVDYTLPIETLRPVVKKFVEQSPLWDKRFWNLQVTDATDRVIQVRVLATAADASKAFDLRCDLREKLIDYIQREHPGALPRIRAAVPDGQAGTTGLRAGVAQNSLPNPA